MSEKLDEKTDRPSVSQDKQPYIGNIEDLPKHMIDNEYILTGCRINFQGWRQVASTLWMFHNETFNIWSHLLGTIFAAAVVVYILMSYPNMESAGKDGPMSQKFQVSNDTFASFVDQESNIIRKDLTMAEINFVQNYQANKAL